MATAKVICKCPHEAQDALHGKNVRVANSTLKGDEKQVEVRCTVCKTIHRVNRSQLRK